MGRHFLDSISCSAALKKLLNLSVSYFPHCWRDWVSRSGSPRAYALISKSVKVHEETLEEKKAQGCGKCGGCCLPSQGAVSPGLEMEFGSEYLLVSPNFGSTFPSPLGCTAERTDSCLECSATWGGGGALRLSTACGQDGMEKK